MHSPLLHRLLAQAHAEDLRRAGATRRSARDAAPRRGQISAQSVLTLRFAFPDDTPAVARLAALDSSDPPASPALVVEVGGELRAALSLVDGAVIADPFYPSTELIQLLRARAAQLSAANGGGRRRGFSARFARLALR